MMWKRAHRVILATLFMGVASMSFVAQAKTPDEVRAQCRQEGRPCVGLVLSGGGARGFAHAGVIKMLEELHIKVDVVTGTSMGSMVGGAYAAGYTSAQLRDVITGVDWKRMFAVDPARRDLPWRQRQEDFHNLTTNAITISTKGVEIPDGLVPSQELTLFLEKETGVVNHINDLSELAVPFAAVATDLVTGERVELQKNVNLSAAMRASMSVPGVFTPATLFGKLLVDGGLVDNLPVEMARRMGADVIIAVNVGTPLMKRSELNNVVSVMGQMVNLLTEQNVERSLASLKPTDILITPDLKDITSADMERGDEIIQAGYVASEKVREKLARLSSTEPLWRRWEVAREHAILPATRVTQHKVDDIRIDGLTYINPEMVKRELELDTTKPITNEAIEEATRRLWADGAFTSIRYRFEPQADGGNLLVFEPKEKTPGYNAIRIGGSVETDFDNSQTFTLTFSHRWGWLNDWGGEWHNEIQAGEAKRFTTEFFQPLGVTSDWFVMPRLEFLWQPYDVYRGNDRIATFRNEQFTASLDLGRSVLRNGYIKGVAGVFSARAKREVGELEIPDAKIHTPYVGAEFYYDTLDDLSFPTQGALLQARYYRMLDPDLGLANRDNYHFSGLWPFSAGPWTLTARADVGKAALESFFSLGGAFQMAGAPYNRWTGSNLQWGSLALARNMSDIVNLKGNPLWLGTMLQVGRLWNDSEKWPDTQDKSWHQGIGFYAGIDSVIGPLYLMTGYTRGVGSGVYFFWGYPMR